MKLVDFAKCGEKLYITVFLFDLKLREIKEWSQRPDSNRRPAHYECAALPTELRWPLFGADNGIRTRDP